MFICVLLNMNLHCLQIEDEPIGKDLLNEANIHFGTVGKIWKTAFKAFGIGLNDPSKEAYPKALNNLKNKNDTSLFHWIELASMAYTSERYSKGEDLERNIMIKEEALNKAISLMEEKQIFDEISNLELLKRYMQCFCDDTAPKLKISGAVVLNFARKIEIVCRVMHFILKKNESNRNNLKPYFKFFNSFSRELTRVGNFIKEHGHAVEEEYW